MAEEKESAHRLAAYSDAVFAVIVTIMVLELRAPDQPAFSALWPLWPTAISYAVSYLFIAIIWINHHYLMRFVGPPTLGMIWLNFVHLFMVSLLPFATAWIARTRLAYAGARAHAAHGEAPLTRCPGDFHDRYTGCVCRTTPRLRSHMRRPDPPLAARGPRQSALQSEIESRSGFTKSMTKSRTGHEQQNENVARLRWRPMRWPRHQALGRKPMACKAGHPSRRSEFRVPGERNPPTGSPRCSAREKLRRPSS